jgi:LysM repeat protein
MKILKIFGIVVGIHVFALILIFANPGCTSTTKPPPAPTDTVARNDASPTISVPTSPTVSLPSDASPIAPAAINFNPDAPATAGPSGGSGGVRFTPTRPNTAAASTLIAEPVSDVTPAASYAVKPGDNLWTLAKRNHLSVSELAAANGLKTNAVLREGQKLIIPGKPMSPTAAATANPAASAGKTAETVAVRQPADATKYVVKQGETLGSIARKFDLKQSEIAVANNITDPRKIRAGDQLVIPGFKNPSAKAGNTTKSGNGQKAGPKENKAPEIPTIGPSDTTAPKPSSANDVPVIKVDDNPISPAPAPKG